jgi:hypothetical protein
MGINKVLSWLKRLEAHEDGFAVDRFRIVELAATVLEFAGAGNARRLFLPREGDNPIFLPILAGIG